MTARKPTPEQEDGLAKFATGKPMRVGAYAGCGKTTMLEMLGRSTARRGSYICFNADGAKEAKGRFEGTNVVPSTTHALAFRTLVRTYGAPKMTGNLSGGFIADRLGLSSIGLGDAGFITPRGHGRLVVDTIKRWCSSDRPEIVPWDVPIDGKLAELQPPDRKALQEQVAKRAALLWQRMTKVEDEMPLTHDGYLKLWAMSRPTIPGEFIFLDEAQDSSGVVLGVLKHQSAQLVAVGDKHQQIYEWRGAINAMTALPCDVEARLSTSWRFGPKIAEHASAILALLGETLPLKGNGARDDVLGIIEAPKAVLARTNSRLIQEVLSYVGAGKKPYVLGGVADILAFVDGAEKLMGGRPVDRPLELFGFKNWREVVAASEGEDGGDLRRWVELIEQHGVDSLRSILENLPKRPDYADVTLSTGHKSKGKEWDTVRILDDFLRGVESKARIEKRKASFEALGKPYTPPSAPDEELRLLYVACTRGREGLYVAPELTEKLLELGAKVAPPALPQEAGETVETPAPGLQSTVSPGDVQQGTAVYSEAPSSPAPKRKVTRLTRAQKELMRGLLERELAATGSQDVRTILDNF